MDNKLNDKLNTETKQERREKKLRKKRERMPQHGKSLVTIYKNAILKRLRRHEPNPPPDK